MFISSGYSAQMRSSATQHHHRAADVVIGGGDLGVARPAKSSFGGLLFELRPGQAVEVNHVLGDRPLSARGDRLAAALEDELIAGDADRGGLTGVHDTVPLADVRKRSGDAF